MCFIRKVGNSTGYLANKHDRFHQHHVLTQICDLTTNNADVIVENVGLVHQTCDSTKKNMIWPTKNACIYTEKMVSWSATDGCDKPCHQFVFLKQIVGLKGFFPTVSTWQIKKHWIK